MERVGQAYAAVRLVWGLGQLVAPRAARRVIGLPDERTGAFGQRTIGVRDAAMGAGVLAGQLRGSTRHWFTACAATDALDAVVIVGHVVSGSVPRRTLLFTLTALGSAGLGAVLALDAASREELVGARRDVVGSPAAQVEYPPAG